MKKIAIFGIPNSGKSQFRRFLVKLLRSRGLLAEHFDADQFKKARCPEDEDCRMPTKEDEKREIIFIIEDVRGTVPGNWWKQPEEYDFIFYLCPDWPTYAMFWVSRALQWLKNGHGDWNRDEGWKETDCDDAVFERVYQYPFGREQWITEDKKLIQFMPGMTIVPVLKKDGEIEWTGFDAREISF